MSDSHSDLLSLVEKFLKQTSMYPTTFGEKVMGDRHLVRRLRAGGSVMLPTADKIKAFIAANTPKPKAKKKRPGRASRAKGRSLREAHSTA